MKMIYIITGVLLVGGLIFCLTSCNNNSNGKNQTTEQNQDSGQVKKTKLKDNPYEGLRKMAFIVTPVQLGLSLPTDKTIVYGVVMDWEISGAVSTTVAYQTGDASMYLSTGYAVIGGGQHPNVNSAAKTFVINAQTFLNETTKTDSTSLPNTDKVKFYFLTNKGIYVGQEAMKNFENNSSTWLQLFEQGNKVLTELRLTAEK